MLSSEGRWDPGPGFVVLVSDEAWEETLFKLWGYKGSMGHSSGNSSSSGQAGG